VKQLDGDGKSTEHRAQSTDAIEQAVDE